MDSLRKEREGRGKAVKGGGSSVRDEVKSERQGGEKGLAL